MNVKQAIPFFGVASMEESLRFYVDALQFKMTRNWTVRGKLRWCWLEIGGAALMLQEHGKQGRPETKVGLGVTICFQCEDALAIYHEAVSRGVKPQIPFVGNSFWVTNMNDPDGYNLSFESPTDQPEETVLTLP